MPCPTDYEGVNETLASESDAAGAAAAARPPSWRRGAVAACALGAVALAVTAARARLAAKRPAGTPSSVVTLVEDTSDAEPSGTGCGGPGDSCQDSGCCLDGGASGYQCFAKNKDYAQCMEGCKKGPHDDETDGEYDQWGNFRQFEWSCEKIGNRSKKGCDTLKSGAECGTEDGRCTWGSKNGTDTCLISCAVLPADGACSSQEHCMTYGGKCEPDCGIFDNASSCPTERCTWAADECQTACWAIGDEASCGAAMWDPRGCVWDGGQCKEDPCSAMDESCLDTKCCSSFRGGRGKTCFQKDENYGKCMDFCDQDDELTKGWSCNAVGNRTKWDIGCTWIGQDCSQTHLCCQAGSGCIVKDDEFTGCIQTQTISSWESRNVEIPSDWEGTTVGGSRNEYELAPAGEGQEKAGAVLFCFMAYLPDSSEVGLMALAKELNASIYGCDDYAEFQSWQSGKKQWDTGDGGASITNTDVFINVWEQVKDHGGYLRADWTVKVDPDAVMVADRLRNHIYGLNAPKDMAIYLKNNDMDKGLGNNGFLGAIEVFSKQALQIYYDNWEGCKEAYGLDSGEDGFMKGCMDAMGVGFMTDGNMFNPDFSPGACANEGRAAFHPLKEQSQWRCCWDIIMGKTRDVKFGKCDMGDDGLGPAEELEYGGVVR